MNAAILVTLQLSLTSLEVAIGPASGRQPVALRILRAEPQLDGRRRGAHLHTKQNIAQA